MLLEVGRFFELYQQGDAEVAALLGLSPLRPNARGARWGFPVRLLARYLRRLLGAGRCVLLVRETKRYLSGMQVRLPACRLVPLSSLPETAWGRV